ncbi:MAG: hypothetical protein LC808_09160, partial [Actinobacteria bacterium]|nr:hypothetical protein [Actinomycetota bacterium]
VMTGSTGVVVTVRAVGDFARPVHLAALAVPEPPGAVTTLCGTLLTLEQIDIVESGTGIPCTTCLIHHAIAEQPATPPVELIPGGPMALTRQATPQGYAGLGWPVTIRGNQVLLALGTDLIALIMPAALAERVTELLTARDRPVPVLAHPDAPEQRIVLTTEPFGVDLPWSPQIRRAAGRLPLPPTLTPSGPVTWTTYPTDTD